MLAKLYSRIDDNSKITIKKFVGAEDVSSLGALPCGAVVTFEVTVPTRLGVDGIVMRIRRDGREDRDIAFLPIGKGNAMDVYSYSLDTAWLCQGADSGLFYYEFLFLRGLNTLFTDTQNNLDFSVSEKEGQRFRLLVYSRDFETPSAFGRGVMYQIFVDRFYRGEGEEAKNVPMRADAEMNFDWDNGIPQFAAKNGEPLKNNMFFGGTLWGVAEKLDYLASLGVTFIYLCPVFEAYSNHKYDTGDYSRIDDMFGGEQAFDDLVSKARERGIGIILDGVFNHTGDDSVYFNRYRRYGEGGAYNDGNSPYKDWYRFRSYPYDYESWWQIEILPKLNHQNESCRRYFTGEDGIIQKYIKRGIAGWRLDVADELSDEFLDELRVAAKSASGGEAVIIGEVWENAADKVAYGKRRRYFQGRQLDSVMNYPLKNAIVDFCLYGDADCLYNTLTEIYASYPKFVSDKLMNLLGTHDTERILTVLGRDMGDGDAPNAVLATKRLSAEQRVRGASMLKLAAVIQFCAYGIPCIYYGDEVGVEGYGDPFCRMPFPWREMESEFRADILRFYKKLGQIRHTESALDEGSFWVLDRNENALAFVRENGDDRLIVAVSRQKDYQLELPARATYRDLLSGQEYRGNATVKADGAVILKEMRENL
ncbi:MAG: alpha amylase C-terminal domain-containing protein [Clostridia bacterium]|nr:alpha amylase C-terminal domain-containing protein [Clostridia bacterium]